MSARIRLIAVAAMIMLAGALAPSLCGQAKDWQEVKIPPLPAFHPEQPLRLVLPNGMTIFLEEDHELPLVHGVARVRGGSRDEPASKVGLVDIYGDVWRTGGTKTKTGDELDDYLEARGARVESSGGVDSTTLSFDCLKENLDQVFPVFVDLLRSPEFRADKVLVAQRQVETGIARRNDQPGAVASREARKIAYGADSPYAREPEYATVQAVMREDLTKWHDTYVHPNNIILGVVGDFDAKAMEARLRSAFADWTKGAAPKPLQITFAGPKPGVYFVEKEDVNQSNIRLVAIGIRRDNPDYYAIQVLDELFGGGFSSRLVQDVRTAKGLAYAVGGGIRAEYDHPGLFQISAGTQSARTGAAIQAIYDQIDGLRSHPPTVEEIKKAKDSILNSFVFEVDSKQKVLERRIAYDFYGYPADFLERYRAGIEKVTPGDVSRAVEKYVQKDQLALVVVGRSADFDKPLAEFGKVTTLDITIPPPPGGGQ